MEQREIEISEKWGAIKSQSEDDLKKVSKDIYNNLIFTDRHCGQGNMMSCFMVLMFMGPQPPEKPKHPSKPGVVENDRDNTLYDLVDRDLDQKKYEEDMKWYDVECKYYNEQKVPSIGMVYEYYDKAGPTSINGLPVFMSLRLLNKEDANKVSDYYTTYKEIREIADNF